MFVKIINNCISKFSKENKEDYTYINIDYDSFVKNKAQGLYETCIYGVILKEGKPIRKNIISYEENKKETIVSNKEKQLNKIKETFEKAIDTNVKWKNGYYYKPRYASESYETLISAELAIRQATGGKQTKFPLEIWDATKKHSVLMTFEELLELAMWLANIYEKQFQQYKTEYAKLLGDYDE